MTQNKIFILNNWIALPNIEVFENSAPVLVTEKSLIANSGGAGKYKGGSGQRFAYKNIGKLPIDFWKSIKNEAKQGSAKYPKF